MQVHSHLAAHYYNIYVISEIMVLIGCMDPIFNVISVAYSKKTELIKLDKFPDLILKAAPHKIYDNNQT